MPTLDYYGGNVWVYEGVYFMFTHRTWHWSARKYPTTEKIEPGMFAPAIVSAAAPFAPLSALCAFAPSCNKAAAHRLTSAWHTAGTG